MTEILRHEETVPSADRTPIYCRTWQPAEGAETRPLWLVFIHGFPEHSGRYERVATRWAARGFPCAAFDYRGHGKSGGVRAYCESFQEFLDDLDAFLGWLAPQRGETPLAIVGHSHGALLTIAHTLQRGPAAGLVGTVLSSPFLGIAVKVGWMKERSARLMSRLAPTLAIPSGIPSSDLSHDPEVAPAYDADPLIPKKVTVRWFTEVTAIHAAVRDRGADYPVPCLVLQAGDDRIVDVGASRRFGEALPKDRGRYEELPGLYHEIFNEVEADREKAFAFVDEWLEDRLAELRSTAKAAAEAAPAKAD